MSTPAISVDGSITTIGTLGIPSTIVARNAAAVAALSAALDKLFTMQNIDVGSIPSIVLQCMIIVKDYRSLTGEEKKQVVIDAITQWIKGLGIPGEIKGVMIAVLPALVPNLIELNCWIDRTREQVFKNVEKKCVAMSCFKC